MNVTLPLFSVSNLPEIAVLSPVVVLAAGGASFLISLLTSKLVADAKLLPDHPNKRSSHVEVTSRAGGVSIFIGWATGLAAITVGLGNADAGLFLLGLGALGGFVFSFGLTDDQFSLRPVIKLSGQILAAVMFVLLFGALETVPLPGAGLTPLGNFAAPVTVLWIVAFMNVFNFMDGVNGIAATSAVLVLSVFGVIAVTFGAPLLAVAAIVLAFSTLGFLPANLAHGRLFMGDSGSHTIGFLMAAFAVLAANATSGKMNILFVPAAMAPFIFDVALTMIRRIKRKKNLFIAHRGHLYQLLARSGATHGGIAGGYLLAVVAASIAATAMLRAPTTNQWIILTTLYVGLAIPAYFIIRHAYKIGVHDDDALTVPGMGKEMSGDGENIPNAAE